MSFNIPIIFDDSPFFDWGEMRRPQSKRNYQGGGRRQRSVFGQWEDPEFFYDYPSRRQHYGPKFGEGRRGYGRNSCEENRFEDEGSQEDIYDTEEHPSTPTQNHGFDGWDILVQHMDKKSSHKHHKHKHKQMPKHKSKSGKAHHDIGNNNEEPSERKADIESKTEKTNVKKYKTEQSNEKLEQKSEKKSTRSPESQTMEPQSNVNSESQSSSSKQTESENSDSTEIPISYSRPKNTHRRLSKRLSQCDPPSPADVKLARIKSIVQKVEGIEEKIAEFVDPVQNKNYLYISETLMKILLDLDTVDSEGFDVVRSARKEGVRIVQALVDKLEAKLAENKINANPE